MSDPSTASPVRSVDRALQLALLLCDGERLTVSEAAARLGIVPSTAHRLLNALVHRGFAVQDRERRYSAGPVLVREEPRPTTTALRRAAHSALEHLHERAGETVQVMVLAGRDIQFVDGIEDVGAALRVGMRVGVRMPAYCSAGGKAMLAELNTVDVEALYRGGLPPWPGARFDSLAPLKRHLATVRRVGYGTSVEETERGVHGVGVAVHAPSGAVVAALTVAVPSARFRRESLPAYVGWLGQARAVLEARLGEVLR